jgi:hypothetical protein
MNEPAFDRYEAGLGEIAALFPYPPTPDIAAKVRGTLASEAARPGLPQRWVLVAVVIAVMLAGVLAVPQVRAAMVDFLQLGAVRIFLVDPTATATLAPGMGLEATVSPTPSPTTTITPGTGLEAAVTPTPLASIFQLPGETTLAGAQAQVDYTLRLPTYPADLGEPDHIFFPDPGLDLVIMEWVGRDPAAQPRLIFYQLRTEFLFKKLTPQAITETTVNGQWAIYTEGPYLLHQLFGDQARVRQVESQGLLWVEGDVTYRLEGDFTLEEAVRIAESLE